VNSRPESHSLQELQARFSAALLARAHDAEECVEFARSIVDDTIPALARLRVYRNNSRLVQADALGRTYPVVRRRVGEDFFARLAAEYRDAHPSPRGDLHWIGERFAPWLATRLARSGYEWLADLARLEWACEQALVAGEAVPLPLGELGRVPPDALAHLRIGFSPSLRLVSSPWPVWSVWKANQPDAAGEAVDLANGPEHVAVACVDGELVLLSLPDAEFRCVAALASDRPLGAALETSGLPVERLAAALGRLFAERLIVGLRVSAQEAVP
jgi:hypothetical protein